MSAILQTAFRALEHRTANTRSVARRRAVFDISVNRPSPLDGRVHDGRAALVDELQAMIAQQLQQILDNFQAGDDCANGQLLANVIQQVADSIHAKHPEDDER